jgi:hypothetical protein
MFDPALLNLFAPHRTKRLKRAMSLKEPKFKSGAGAASPSGVYLGTVNPGAAMAGKRD